MPRRERTDGLLLGEWACLGAVYPTPTHGFAVARRLQPDGDLGRVWSMTRPLTYRALDQLLERRLVEQRGIEPGRAGGERTVLAASRTGRAALRRWVTTPVVHLRDLRTELLLKLTIAEHCNLDVSAMLHAQHVGVAQTADALRLKADDDRADVIALWRSESADAAVRFLRRLTEH
jgi:DNA-binding PadR family transcriptional regulator